MRSTVHLPLLGTNISHLGKGKIIFKSDFWWDIFWMPPWRVDNRSERTICWIERIKWSITGSNSCLHVMHLLSDTVDERNPANHLGCIKPCKWWEIYHINWCRISFINRIKCIITVFAHAETDLDLSLFLIREFETATRIRRVFGSLKVDSTFQQKPDPKNTCLKRKAQISLVAFWARKFPNVFLVHCSLVGFCIKRGPKNGHRLFSLCFRK